MGGHAEIDPLPYDSFLKRKLSTQESLFNLSGSVGIAVV